MEGREATGICTICSRENPVRVREVRSNRVRALCAFCREATVHYVRRVEGPWPCAVEPEHLRNARLVETGVWRDTDY